LKDNFTLSDNNIGHPTLRLLRVRIGNFWLGDLPPGKRRVLSANEIALVTLKTG
jgi:23S rRNA pseudouridine2457 synthase